MIDFSMTSPFRLVRRLAMGQGSNAMYLLIYEDGAQSAIEADLKSEVEVQLSSSLPIGRVSEMLDVDNLLGLSDTGDMRVLRIDRWSPELVALLDTHVIRLEKTGAQLVFLTTLALTERLLSEAPNFRNRLIEILRIVPDDPSRGSPS